MNSLLKENTYSSESLLLELRRSLRGDAADMAVRLAEIAGITDWLDMFLGIELTDHIPCKECIGLFPLVWWRRLRNVQAYSPWYVGGG